MNYEKLDNEELLFLSLGAINAGRDADAVVMLKTLLEREPGHVHARYLLAAQHAQIGLRDRAERGFRAVVADAPDFAIARFQLGQLLLTRGEAEAARETFAPLIARTDALGAYARAMRALAGEDTAQAADELQQGLALEQEIPALAADMQRLLEQLRAAPGAPIGETLATPAALAAPRFLASYGREN